MEARARKKGLLLFSTWQWITIVGGMCVTAVSLAAAAFTTFELKEDHDKFEGRIDSRLERMETKIDQLLLKEGK